MEDIFSNIRNADRGELNQILDDWINTPQDSSSYVLKEIFNNLHMAKTNLSYLIQEGFDISQVYSQMLLVEEGLNLMAQTRDQQ